MIFLALSKLRYFLPFLLVTTVAIGKTSDCRQVQIRTRAVVPGNVFFLWNKDTDSFDRLILTPSMAQDINVKSASVMRQLNRILRKKGLSNYCLSKKVIIDPTTGSRSGEEISIDPLSLQYPNELLAIFVHEQLHSIVHMPQNEPYAKKTLDQLRELYPHVHEDLLSGKLPQVDRKNRPCVSFETYEENRECTYEHLLVNLLEMDAIEKILKNGAYLYRRIISDHGIYAGIYQFLKSGADREIRSLLSKHPIMIERLPKEDN